MQTGACAKSITICVNLLTSSPSSNRLLEGAAFLPEEFISMKGNMFNTKELAEYLSINEKQVYRLIKERRIPATRITGKWLFPRQLIDEWVMYARQLIGKQDLPAGQVCVCLSQLLFFLFH